MRACSQRLAFAALLILPLISEGAEAVADDEISASIQTRHATLQIGADARALSLVDRRTATDYCDRGAGVPVAALLCAKQKVPASAVSYEDDCLTVEFAKVKARAELRVEVFDRYFTLEVLSLEGGDADELVFLDVPLKLKGSLDEPFACCALALNLLTNVREIPGPSRRLRAECARRFGFRGAKVAVIACPTAELRDVMKDVVSASQDIPRSSIGGPWAMDADINRGSYLFDFGALTEKTVDSWIDLAKKLGMTQIDFHTGRSLRFGDYTPHPDLFPRGRDSVKAVIDKLHAAGIAAGLHTYAFFIAKDSPYVTPVPDPRLGKDATFTLAEDVAADSKSIPVNESTADMSLTTGFFVRNSVTLRVDEELITYTGVSKEPPFTFTGCQRGACGTRASAHPKGAQAHHLKQCFGLFAPDADSTLLSEVAANTASAFNECGFDMIYLDALDGEDILAGRENSWHYGSKFVFEIARRLNKPALFEMSTFHHHLWYVRARMGAWDHPSRSHKRFIDEHCAANNAGRGMFLPMNLGWWAVKAWAEGNKSIQCEPTYPDDIEYLMCKCLANDMGFALMGVNPGNIDNMPAYQRLAPIFRQYEDLRHAKYFPDSIKTKLKAPGKDFTLEKREDGQWQFRPAEYAKHKVCALDGRSNVWTVHNGFDEQPLRLRIEGLMSVATYNSAEAVVIEDFSDPKRLSERSAAEGVSIDLTSEAEDVKAGKLSGCLAATSNRDAAKGSWCKVGRRFSPVLNIDSVPALGVWIKGDGQGEILNVQLLSPSHVTHGLGDRYVKVDFTGWRYFELVELEGARVKDYSWPYGNAYSIYRESVNFGQVETLSVWLNNLPQGKPVRCLLSPLKALPLVKAKLSNPRITVNGKPVSIPAEIESGSYLELAPQSGCRLYGPKGELLADPEPTGRMPMLRPGDNEIKFECDVTPAVSARARVTVITLGQPLHP